MTKPAGHRCRRRWFVHDPIANTGAASPAANDSAPSNLLPTVKFDDAKLPAILNAVETQNNDQKLVMEVAVRIAQSMLVLA